MNWYAKPPNGEAVGPLTERDVIDVIKSGALPVGSYVRDDDPGSPWLPLQDSPFKGVVRNPSKAGCLIFLAFAAVGLVCLLVGVQRCADERSAKKKSAQAMAKARAEARAAAVLEETNEKARMVANLRASETLFKERQYARCKESTLEVPVFLPQCREAVDICFRKSVRALEEGNGAGEAYEDCFFPTLTRLINSSSEPPQ